MRWLLPGDAAEFVDDLGFSGMEIFGPQAIRQIALDPSRDFEQALGGGLFHAIGLPSGVKCAS